MEGISITVKAIFIGLSTGLILALPLGPAGLESVKRTISKGYKEGILVALGAISVDALDIILINFGIFNLLDASKRLESLFWIICGIILAFIGYKSVKGTKKGEDGFKPKAVKSGKFSSMPYVTGFLITVSNPLTHSLWITMSGTVIRAWYYKGNAPYIAFISSMIIGMIIWLLILNYLALRGQKFVASSTSKIVSLIIEWAIFGIGIVFILYGLIKLIFNI
jgi:threonine/homoserine/homoserine lactone efflux protein